MWERINCAAQVPLCKWPCMHCPVNLGFEVGIDLINLKFGMDHSEYGPYHQPKVPKSYVGSSRIRGEKPPHQGTSRRNSHFLAKPVLRWKNNPESKNSPSNYALNDVSLVWLVPIQLLQTTIKVRGRLENKAKNHSAAMFHSGCLKDGSITSKHNREKIGA